MIISPSLRKRFCKDFSVPIAIFDEPYFTDRMEIANKIKPCIKDWDIFVDEVKSFATEQDYFEYYNRVKDNAINHIKENPAYEYFNSVSPLPVIKNKYPKENLYSPLNDGKNFISIDMRKANFSALKVFDENIFDCYNTWEDWIKQFTDMKHIINSKYIRQVIMGALNPSRQISYEKYLTVQLYENIKGIPNIELYSLLSDEIILKPVNDKEEDINKIIEDIIENIRIIIGSRSNIFKIDSFILEALHDNKGYVKHYSDKQFELKCVSAEDFHFVAKEILGIPVTDNDMVFRYNGKLARYIE